MSDFRAGDTVRFTCFDRQYVGVLSDDGHGHLQVKDEDYTYIPDGANTPSGNWLVFYNDGAPAFAISNVRLIHRPAQEGSTMNTTVRLREGDRITYQYVSTPDPLITSDPLRAVESGSLHDAEGGFYVAHSDGKAREDMRDVTLIERHGLPVEVHELEGYGPCVIYTTLQDTDGMYFMQVTDEHHGVRGPLHESGLGRLGVPKGHPLYSDAAYWDWLTTSEMDDSGVDRSAWPTPLRYADNTLHGQSDSPHARLDEQRIARIAELEAALEAEREERKREMLDYKAQVKAMARQVGADHGWCVPGQNEVLRDLGIETRTKSRVSVALEFDMVAFTDTEDPTRAFAQDSLVQQGSMGEVVAALRELIDLDSDWDDAVFDESSINFRVTGVEEEQ